MAVNVPSFLPEPFANEGQRATIPDTPSSEQGRASYQQGFPQVCAQPLASGGIPPNYLDFQGVLYDLSNSIFYMQTGALWPWSASLTYPRGAHVLGSDNNEYVAVQESTGQDPTNDPTNIYWLRADIALKADVSLGNVNSTGQAAMAHAAMPSDQYIDISVSNGLTYQAPADGYFYLNITKGKNGSFTAILLGKNATFGTTSRCEVKENATNPDCELPCTLAVKRDDWVTFLYSADGVFRACRFYYANGSAPQP